MDFFKSVFSADQDPSSPSDSPRYPPSDAAADDAGSGEDSAAPDPDPDPVGDDDVSHSRPAAAASGGLWGFGGLIKTLSSKSESVIQTYRRDLEEFGSGLKKESVAIREAAARAVRDLPGSLEAGASAAQESLESVGQAIDQIGGTVWRGTAEIIAQGKDAILAMDSAEAAARDSSSDPLALKKINPAVPSKPYSRFDAQLLAIQSDASTFWEEPEDGEDFQRWRTEFDMAAKEEEIEILCYENANLEGFLESLVPKVLDYETFWCRYYYRVHKLKQAEDARSKLVKRVIAGDEEEDLSWEVDDDEEEVVKKEEEKQEKKNDNLEEQPDKKEDHEEESKEEVKSVTGVVLEPAVEEKPVGKEFAEPLEEKEIVEVPEVKNMEAQLSKANEEVISVADKAEGTSSANEEVPTKLDNNAVPEAKGESSGSCKDSEFSVISSQPSVQEEDDLGWDEIEDLGEHDDKKSANPSGSSLRDDIRKRLSTAEDDEDLSWDIEEDDEPAKS